MNDQENNQVKVVGRLWRPRDVAKRWMFHPETIRRKIRNGEIGSIIIGGRRLVPEEEVLRVEAEGSVDCVRDGNQTGGGK